MEDAPKLPAVVIGGGVVGCAVAYELSLRGAAPWVLERGPRIAEGVTSRNSGVIHAGIYYPPKSLKAQSCIRGKELLYEWCVERGVPHRRTGKWIVGVRGDEADLQNLLLNSEASGASGVAWADPSHMSDRLPGVRADLALFSADTGIVDPYELSRSYQCAAEEKGAEFLMNTDVTGISRQPTGSYLLETSRGPLETELVVNSAGLYADRVASFVGVDRYKIYPWRGDYFRLRSRHAYSELVYPVKKKGAAGLGVHLTLALDGSYRLGPDVQLVESIEDFSAPSRIEAKTEAFLAAVRKYMPDVAAEHLSYDSCGIRPKLRSPQDVEDPDFVLSEDLPGFFNLVGIESPGLTASRDLAQRLARKAFGS